MATYRGKPVTVVRSARKGDEGFDEDTDQVVVKLEDGTEKTVARTDVQDTGQQSGGQQQGKPQPPR